MVELPFVAGVELQLVLGIVNVANAENVFVEKLLWTLAEIFELGGGDGGDGVGEFGAECCVVIVGEEVAVEDRFGPHLREQLQLAAPWERGRPARCFIRDKGTGGRDARVPRRILPLDERRTKILQQLRLPLRLLRDDETLQQRRGTERFAESVPAGEGEVDRLRAVEQKLKEHPLLIASVADLADVEPLPVVVGKERIVEAPLREDVVLHAHGEEVREGTAAEAHDVGAEDFGKWSVRRFQRFVLKRVDDRGRIEADVPWIRTAEGRGDFVDGLGGSEIELRLDCKPAERVRQKVRRLRGAERRLRRQRLDLGEHGDIRVDRGVARDRLQLFTRSAGDAETTRRHIDLVDVDAAFRIESAAQQLDDIAARKAVLAQAEQRGDGASEAMRDERRLIIRRQRKSFRRSEAIEQRDVVRIERAGDDADVARVDAQLQQCTGRAASLAKLDRARVVLRDIPLRLPRRIARLLAKARNERFRESIRLPLGRRNVNRFQFSDRPHGFDDAPLRAGHVVEARHDLRRDGNASALDDGSSTPQQIRGIDGIDLRNQPLVLAPRTHEQLRPRRVAQPRVARARLEFSES